MKLHIEIAGKAKGKKPRRGGWAYEYRDDLKNIAEKPRACGFAPVSTNNRALLLALTSAIDTLKTPIDLVVSTSSQYIVNGINIWMQDWAETGRLNAPGMPNGDLWNQVYKFSQEQSIRAEWLRNDAFSTSVNKLADEQAAIEPNWAQYTDSSPLSNK